MNKLANSKIITVLLAVSLTGSIQTARAAEPAATAAEVKAPAATAPAEPVDKDKWAFTAPLYMWLAGIDGNIKARGRSADVNASFGDIISHVDISFMGYFQLAKPRYGVYTQPVYLKLADSGKAGPIKADLTSELWVVDFGAFYKFWVHEGERPASIAALAGGRYYSLHNELTLKDPLGKTKIVSSASLCDPIIGLRYTQYFTEKLHAWVEGDIGGFGLTSSQSEFSWQVQPLLGYDFMMPVIHKRSTVFAGYRVLGIQNTKGGGANKESYNLRLSGAVVGLNVELF